MTRRQVIERCAWEDRFRLPTVDELREGMNSQHRHMFDLTRDLILAIGSLREQLSWHGVPWRWALSYKTSGGPLGYLVPQPGKPLLAVPLPVETVAALPVKKLSRAVRDAIAFSAEVSGTCWPTWELQSKALVEEVVGLLRGRADAGLAATA